MADDPLREAHASLVAAIAELRLMQVPVPVALHRAAHALTYAIANADARCRVLQFNREPRQ